MLTHEYFRKLLSEVILHRATLSPFNWVKKLNESSHGFNVWLLIFLMHDRNIYFFRLILLQWVCC